MIQSLGMKQTPKAKGQRLLLLAPTPDLPDDTEIKDVQLPITIGLVLKNAGIRTVGEIRKTPDADLRKSTLTHSHGMPAPH